MSDYPGMSHDELIAALRSDMKGTSAERAHALAEVARLEAAAKAASMPDAQIRAGLHAIRQKFADLFK